MTQAGQMRADALKQFMQGKFDEAIALFKQALETDPRDKEALRGLAMAYGQKGQADEAVSWAQKLIEAAPDEPLSHATLSMLLQRQGKIKEAEDAQAQARVLDWKDQLKKPGH